MTTPPPQYPPLPRPLTPLLGRQHDLERLVGLLHHELTTLTPVRLATLTGPGGVGKTRLALQAAIALAPAFASGAVFVPLEAVRDPDEVAWAISARLALPAAGQRPIADQLAAHLADQHLLLVLDNFEQLLPAATLVADLLARCARLVLLVTSRAPLRLSGEYEFPVQPLTLPDPRQPLNATTIAGSAAVALFLQRASMVAPSFQSTDQNAPAIAEICLRLDGLPLALELAAARLKLLTPQEILTRLKRRFTLLIGGGRDLPDRQRTLRETVAWSYGLLSATEQVLLRRLAIFNGGCSLAAAEAVLTTIQSTATDLDALSDGLTALIDQSLLWRDREEHADTRLRMLETVREFGIEQLVACGEIEAAHRAHADYYLMLAETAQTSLVGSEQARWLALLEAEQPNLRAIFDWTLAAGDSTTTLRLGTALLAFWQLRGYQREGLQLLELALAAGEAVPAELRARASNAAGSLAMFLHDYSRAKAFLTESLHYYRQTTAPRELGDLLSSLGWALILQGDLLGAADAFHESLTLSQQTGHHSSAAWAHNGLGVLARRRAAYTEALTHHQTSLALFTKAHDAWGTAFTLDALGYIALLREDYDRATTAYHESFRHYRALGSTAGVAAALNGLALVAAARGELTRAARLFGTAQTTNTKPVVGVTVLPHRDYEAALTSVRAQLGEAAFSAALTAGQTLTAEQALAEATSPAATTPTRSTPTTLTARELDVLRLVAQGLSDADVADRLFLSRRTVQSYLTTIYGKFSVNSRTAAVRHALDHGIL